MEYTKSGKIKAINITQCFLLAIDNLPEFRSAAERVGIKTFNINQGSIEEFLKSLK